jgi:hypothetical protein
MLGFLAGQAVIKAGKNGTVFPLKKRDIMLDYIIALMATDETKASDLDLLHTQVLLLFENCTTAHIAPRKPVTFYLALSSVWNGTESEASRGCRRWR